MENREAPTRTAGDEPPRHFRRGRRPLGFGEARRRRRGRRRHGRGGSASSARRIGLILEPTTKKNGLNSENIMTATKPEGKLVEHWGFPEKIPPQEQLKNNIGMF